jgi:hypothetical protein
MYQYRQIYRNHELHALLPPSTNYMLCVPYDSMISLLPTSHLSHPTHHLTNYMLCALDDSMISLLPTSLLPTPTLHLPSQIQLQDNVACGCCILPSRITCFAFGSLINSMISLLPTSHLPTPTPHLPPPIAHSVLFVVLYVYEGLGRGFVHHTQRASWGEQSCTCLYM